MQTMQSSVSEKPVNFERTLLVVSGPSGDDAKISAIIPYIVGLSLEQQEHLESESIMWSIENGHFNGVPDWRELAEIIEDWKKSEELEDELLYLQWIVIISARRF